MNDSIPNGSNEHRIRNLESEVERLRTIIDSINRRSFRTPVAKLVQMPADGVAGRDPSSDEAVEVELDVVWTDANKKIYLTGQKQKCRNVSTTAFSAEGSRLAWALLHDDGFWILHAFDCDDTGDNVVLAPTGS